MRYLFKALTLVGVTVLCACGGQKSAGLQESAVAPDKTLYENGAQFLSKHHYIKARLSFQTLISTYPDSEYTAQAFLSKADSYYEESGKTNLMQAETEYKDFIIFYPNHDLADDAQMKIAAVNVRLMKPYDRDPTYARRAEIELKEFLKKYPNSDLVPTAREFLRDVQENLATGTQEVGRFYLERSSYTAAESRYKEVLEKYPDYSQRDEALFRLARALEELGHIEEASVQYAEIAREFPFSKYFELAREKLGLLEKPIPAVEPIAAARRKANLRPVRFSFLAPVKNFVEIFTGGEDPYEVAKRRAAEKQAANQKTSPAESPALNP